MLIDIIEKIIEAIIKYFQERRKRFKEFVSKVGYKVTADELLEYRAVDVLRFHIPGFMEKYYSIKGWDDRIAEILRGGRSVLVKGEAGLGKTRACVEALRRLFKEHKEYKDATVFFAKHSTEVNDAVPPGKLGTVILFLDDLDKYAGKVDVPGLIRRFRNASRRLLLVSTCRAEAWNIVEED